MNPALSAFCVRSLCREYGLAFLARVIFAHPMATARGIARYSHGPASAPPPWRGGEGSLVGIGFCLKPLLPACPSGRSNHRCAWFDDTGRPLAAPCRDCLVRAMGRRALASRSAVYIMTSARDILHDVLLPAVARGRFRSAVLVMCRYSFEPMRLALAMCGIEARLFPFLQGDCRDYATWRRADTGDKPEQTALDAGTLAELTGTLAGGAQGTSALRFERAGNIYQARSSEIPTAGQQLE